MTNEQFKQLADKLDRILALLEAQQGKDAESFTFTWPRDETGLPRQVHNSLPELGYSPSDYPYHPYDPYAPATSGGL